MKNNRLYIRNNSYIGRVYLDYASTTPVDPRVVKAMEPYWTEKFGNPSNLYSAGRQAFQALEKSRANIAQNLGCLSEEIIFTSGGTESCNLALRGLAKNFPKGHLIISSIEHHAVLKTAQDLESQGFRLTISPVDKEGIIKFGRLKKAITSQTFLISIMWVNNEIGTIQPIERIARWLKRLNVQRIARGLKRVYLHVDACQALPYLKINLKKTPIDLLSLNGSKIYGPKGIGALYLKQKTPLLPILTGGDQELGLRAGTQNVALAVGLAKAFSLIQRNRAKENQRLLKLRDYLIKKLKQRYPEIVFNGSLDQRVASNINFSVPGIEGEALTLMLDRYGLEVATGSACASLDLKPSHVLTAMGLPDEIAHCSVRITLGKDSTKQDLDYFLKIFEQVYKKLKTITAVPSRQSQSVRVDNAE
jgi:cysteine desulfurase